MLSVKRHPNLDNWFEVRIFGELIDQFTSAVKAIQFAEKIKKKERFDIVHIDLKRQDEEN
jgi:hypothetical protein